MEEILNDFEFTYNVAYDTFTHDETGYMMSGDYLRSASNDEVVMRIYNATGVEVEDALIEALRTVSHAV